MVQMLVRYEILSKVECNRNENTMIDDE